MDKIIRADVPFQTLFERRLSYFLSPLESFVHKQTTSGILLVAFSIIAFVLSNSPWQGFLERINLVQLGIAVDEWKFSLSVNDWISQGLMMLFFFLTGLELKREIIAGKLSEVKEIKLVCAAALGGILALLARRVSIGLTIFLTALAIFDDIPDYAGLDCSWAFITR